MKKIVGFLSATIISISSFAQGSMRITEFMYNGGGASSVGEFVEFTNVGNANVDMTGWSFDDNGRVAGSQSLSGFGIVKPGESVILTELTAATFRTNWNLCAAIKVIGGSTNGLGRADEINLYNGSTLVDRLTYDDENLGGPRTASKSGWVTAAGLGANNATLWTLSGNGDAEASFSSTLSEIGSPGKSKRATVSFNPCAVVAGAPTIVMNVNATTNYLDGGVTTAPISPYAISGVISDPTDPARTLGIDFLISDNETNINNLTTSVSSSNTTVVPIANLSLTGTGEVRNLKITPAAVGYSILTVTVNDGTNTSSYVITYSASAASATPSKTVWHTGMSDASEGVPIDDDYYITADDEINIINVYSRTNSGLPLKSFDFTSGLNLPDPAKPEVDVEASARSSVNTGRIYWIGSMSNGKDPFDDKPNRNRIFATNFTGTGAATSFTMAGYYGSLRAKIVSWGDAHSYNFSASAAEGVDSKLINGFAIESMAFGPDNTTLWIGLRAPLVPTSNRKKAVIAPITNFETWFNNGSPSGNPVFGQPIELDLGGRGFRDLIKLSNGTYVIVAGNPAGDPITSAIYKWSGKTTDAPILVNTSANGILNLEGVMPVNVAGQLSLNSLQVITDGGGEILYNDATEAKDLGELNRRKFRSDILSSIDLTLSPVTGLESQNSSSFLNVSPNPANGFARIHFALEYALNMGISISDMNGHEVVSFPKHNYSAGEQQIELNTSKLENGIYLVKIASDTFSKKIKLVVQH